MSSLQQRDADVLTLVAPSGGVTVDVPVQIGNIVVVPQDSALEGVIFAGQVRGNIKMPKKAGETWAVTDDLFFSAADSALTKTDTGSLLRCGKPTEAVTDAAAVLAWVLFDGGVAASSVNPVDIQNMATMAAVAAASGNVIQSAGASRAQSDSTVPVANLVTEAAAASAADQIVTSAGASKVVKDSGIAIANVPTMAAASAGAKKVVRSGGADKTLVADGPDYDLLPTMAAVSAAAGNLIQSAGADRTQSDSTIPVANVPTMAAAADAADRLILAAGADKTLKGGAFAVSDIIRQSKFVPTEVTIALGATSGSSAANPALIGGTIMGFNPKSGNDQEVVSIVVNGDGSITVTVAAAETAEAKFNVMAYSNV